MDAEQQLKGLDSSMIEYLVGMSQEMFAPSEFDVEVQRLLDEEGQ